MKLQELVRACLAPGEDLPLPAELIKPWESWLQPLKGDSDASREDDYQYLREEVGKTSGIDAEYAQILAERLFTQRTKDLRVAVYYLWARTQAAGLTGLADGLILLAGVLARFPDTAFPVRLPSRRSALQWVAGAKVVNGLALHPDAIKVDIQRALGALVWLEQLFEAWPEPQRPPLVGPLTNAIAAILARSSDSKVQPRTSAPSQVNQLPDAQAMPRSGRDVLDQGKSMARYLRDQPLGWLAGHRLMTVLRWDTLQQLPLLNGAGHTHLMPPRNEHRAQLKNLHALEQWHELLGAAERLFLEGANHFWLDLQWYICEAQSRLAAPHKAWGDIVKRDLGMFLERLPGLEAMHWSDGSPFAEPATRDWIARQVSGNQPGQWLNVPEASQSDDVLALETQARELADSNGIEAALAWLHERSDVQGGRERWQLRLIMARVAEQYGKTDLAFHLLGDLEATLLRLGLHGWEPATSFEVQARLLRLLRQKARCSEADKPALNQRTASLLGSLVAIDPVRAAVLCG